MPIHIILFSLIFVGGAAFATITLQFTAGMEFRLAVTTVLRRVAKSAAFRQLVVIGCTVILLRFGLNNLMQTLAKFSLTPVQWDKTKLYYLLREVYQPLELLLFVAALCTISDAFLPSLIAIPKATVSHVVKSILSTSFIIGFATVVFNLKSRFCKENAWQAEMKGDATSQRRWEAYDKLGTFVIFVMSIVLGIQAMGLEVGSVLAIGGIGGLAIGLAGREICENLLSGFLIMSTNPFEVGDEVTFFHNNKVIEGIVADIGWYRTLIRSFEREMFVIPNAVFSKNIVLNVTRKGREWRLLETISIRVQDVQKANAIAQDIRRIMRSDTRVMNKLHRRVFVDKITKEDVQIYMSFYLDAANRDAFMAIKQDLMVSFVDCVERNGAKLAQPRTVLDLDPEMVEALDSLNVHGYAAYAMARDLVAQKQQQAQMQPAQLPSPPIITAEITAVDRNPPSGPPNGNSNGSSSSSSNGSGSDGGGQVAGAAGGSKQADGPVQAADPLLGDFLVLVSSALYGAYTVVIRLQMPGEEAEGNVALFFGYLGLLTTVVLAPVVLVMVASGAVSLAAIPKEVYLIILLEGLLDYVLSDYLWARAVLLIGPTVATLGLSIQIPIAAVAELLSGANKIQWLSSTSSIALAVLGTAFILAGFVGINLSALVLPPSEALAEAEGISAAVGDHGAGGHGRVSSAGESVGLESELGHFRGKVADDSEWDGREMSKWESDKEGEEGPLHGLRQQQQGSVSGRGRQREESHKVRGKGWKSRSSLGAVRGGVLHRGNSNGSLNGSSSKKGEDIRRGDEDLERGSG